MTFGNYRIEATRPVEPMMEWVVLADIAGPMPFSLIAVWAMNHRASNIKTFSQSNPQPAAALNTYWTEGSGPGAPLLELTPFVSDSDRCEQTIARDDGGTIVIGRSWIRRA